MAGDPVDSPARRRRRLGASSSRFLRGPLYEVGTATVSGVGRAPSRSVRAGTGEPESPPTWIGEEGDLVHAERGALGLVDRLEERRREGLRHRFRVARDHSDSILRLGGDAEPVKLTVRVGLGVDRDRSGHPGALICGASSKRVRIAAPTRLARNLPGGRPGRAVLLIQHVPQVVRVDDVFDVCAREHRGPELLLCADSQRVDHVVVDGGAPIPDVLDVMGGYLELAPVADENVADLFEVGIDR